MNSVDAALSFLTELWPEGWPANCRLLLWTLHRKRSYWFLDIEQAAKFAAEKANVYVGCCLGPGGLPQDRRVQASETLAMPGVWADIDIEDQDAHKSSLLPKTIDEAGQIFLLEPTIVVHSGHGLQAWWLFKEPWFFCNDEDRIKASDLCGGWQGGLAVKAKKLGWKLDNTSDLARVLRVPGTVNAKAAPIEVRVLSSGGPRYNPGDFEPFLAEMPRVFEENGSTNGKHNWEHWLEQGANLTERNVAATSIIGRMLSDVADLSDNAAVQNQWRFLQMWNATKCRPPLEERELRTVFKSILRSARQERIDDDFQAAFAKYVPSPETDVTRKESHPLPATPAGKWHLVIVDSKPRAYRVYSPYWADKGDGYIELTSELMCSAIGIRQQALEQADYWLPPDFMKAWLGTGKKKGLASELIETATFVKAPAEVKRPLVIAERLASEIAMANESDEADFQGFATRLKDGSVTFGFTWMYERISSPLDKIKRNELSGVLERIGAKDYRPREGTDRRRLKILDEDAQGRLAAMIRD